MLAILLTSVHLAIHIPAVQNYVAHKVVKKVEPHINGKLTFNKLTISFFSRVIIEDFSITGAPGDTMVCAKKVAVYLSPKDILRGKLRANRIFISDGIFNYIEEGGKKDSNVSRILSSPTTATKEDTTQKSSWPVIDVKELRLQNYRFYFHDYRPPKAPVSPGCMDYTNIYAYDINLRAYDFATRPEKGITARIHSLSAKEKSGLILKKLSGDFFLNKNASGFKNLDLQEGFSRVRAKYLTFSYNCSKDLKYWIQKVDMDVDFTDTFLDFNTIGIYTPYMQGNDLQVYLNGRVHGTVANLETSRLKIETVSKKTLIDLAISIKGLPKIRKTVFDANIFNLKSTSEETDMFISRFARENSMKILSSYIPKTKFTLRGDMLGTIYDFDANGKFESTAGDVDFDLSSLIKSKVDGAVIKGSVKTSDISLGKILKVNNLGDLSAHTKAEVTIRKKQYGGLGINIDSLSISKLGFKGYNYKNIFAVGKYSEEVFDGRIISHDPNLDLMFQGVATLSDISKKSVYNFYADVPYIDLAALNFVKNKDKGKLSLRTMANISSSGDDIYGNIDIKNVTYWGEKEYKFNSITLTSSFQDQDYKMDIKAPFIEAKYISTEHPREFISGIKSILLEEQFGELMTRKKRDESMRTPATSQLDILTYDTEMILDILMPELYLADSTHIALNIDQKDSLSLNISSDRIALGQNSLKAFDLDVSNSDSLLLSNIRADMITLGKGNLYDNNIDILSKDGVVSLLCKLDQETNNSNELIFNSSISFDRGAAGGIRTNIFLDSSFVNIRGYRLNIDSSYTSLAKREFSFRDFTINNGDQAICIDGTLSEDPADSIKVDFDRFDISIADAFLKKKINIEGELTGNILATGIYGTPNILMDVNGSNIALKSRTVGDLHIMSKWDQNRSRMNLLLRNNNEGLTPLTLSGYYQPSGKFLNMNITLKEFGLSAVEPFLKGALINTGGVISGDLVLMGTMDRLTLNSDNTKIHNFAFTPAYTNVPYVASGDVTFDNSGIYFEALKVHDKFNNEATLTGSLRHNYFRNMYLDASLAFADLQCLNTTERDNQTFYGNAFASGNIILTGPFNNLSADVTATTGARSAIHIPLSSAASAKKEELLKFKQDDKIILDPYLERMKRKNKERAEKEGSKSNFALKARANVTSDTELFIEINKQLGDILRCRGNGAVDINIDPSKSLLDLKGDYTIDEGSYKFVLLGITAKDFTLDNGGTINFNGDIKSTTLNIGATYQTKASVSTLIADTSAVGNRRNVECGIKMSGSLSDPNIGFTVDVKDLDPITKGRVESALSTDDKIQKQFMALILSGSFIPDEQSGIFNNSTILYSNAGEMLSNQVNNVFRQLDIPLDLGFNYQPASDGKAQDMFDVALSYQAFNNRVVINGNVGNNQVSQAWGGDFEAEVKLDKRGKMRLKAFTRSPDDYSNYLDNTQRHGIGFTYQDEFDNFRELLRNIFWSKKRKEAYERQMIMEAEKAISQEQEKGVQ